MVYRIAGGLFLCALAVGYLGILAIPVAVLGVLAGVAGIALLAGL